MTPSLLLLLLLAQAQGLDAPPEAAPAFASAERWRSLARGEATTRALLSRGGVGSREGFVRHLCSGALRWRFARRGYALAQGGTRLPPRADGTLRPVAFAAFGLGVDDAR
jgi:hypothetical protein